MVLALALVGGIGLSAPSVASAADPILIRFGGGAAPTHPISLGQIAFKKNVEELSGGKIKAEVYHANQLGGMVQMMEMVKAGTLTMSTRAYRFVLDSLHGWSSSVYPSSSTTENEHWHSLMVPLATKWPARWERPG